MTDATTPTEPTADPAAPVEQQPEPAGAGREAARYRTQLRETEAKHDALATRLEAMQRAEVERLASSEIRLGSSLWASGKQLADLLDEHGNVDADLVQAAAIDARDTLGLEPKPWDGIIPNQGKTPDNAPRMTSWADALDPHGD
ncbi:hypothetical protein [Agrococcus jejuensis]|uniref:Uncharacterized protein n=1 Tax=Agrococcus jejuensis TaxID=399736 RepID=A0A1G8F076_9MICO|nr:hypothetical protein [Agrococcus jejuensis]SDH75533.1 hypothetical protein SAMN04489720_2267 [Agrococcus jejuensis]